MSNLDRSPRETACGGREAAAVGPERELLPGHPVALGGTRAMTVTRTLPQRDRRMVGAWCFVDHYGPDRVGDDRGMQVPPHPHTGLQTVSWLLAGEVQHHNSLGSAQLLNPGGLNLMTAGRGIAHSEHSPQPLAPVLHGVQLWTALPEHDRYAEPRFEHHATLPVLVEGGLTVTVLLGELDGQRAPGVVYSPLVGADVAVAAGPDGRLPLRPDWEYAALGLSGSCRVDGAGLDPGPLMYLGCGRTELSIGADWPARVLLLGGEPFTERIVMWWNFVGRDHDDIAAARSEWAAGDPRFGPVHGYPGPRLAAPELPSVRLRPRGRKS
jgi:quercetin 2,3-dioxygenase